MDDSTKRKFQLVFLVVLILAGARTLWIFHERNTSAPEKPAPKERNVDDYVYLRPSHAHDLASARAALKGNTVWVKAGNAVAYAMFAPPNHVTDCVSLPKMKPVTCILAPLAQLNIKDVVMSGTQMFAVFTFAPISANAPGVNPTLISTSAQMSEPKLKLPTITYAVPIGVMKNGDATILIDDIFFLEDPHKLYDHWTKDQWAAVERHEITQGMSETQAQAAMGVGRAPESGEGSGDYGNRTLVFTDPAHPDKPVTARFVDNAVVTISK